MNEPTKLPPLKLVNDTNGKAVIACWLAGPPMKIERLSWLDWKPVPLGPVPEAEKDTLALADSGPPMVVRAFRVARAENDTNVPGVRVKLANEGDAAFAEKKLEPPPPATGPSAEPSTVRSVGPAPITLARAELPAVAALRSNGPVPPDELDWKLPPSCALTEAESPK